MRAGNPIDFRHVVEIGNVMIRNSTLRSLNIDNCRIEDAEEGARRFE